MVYWVHVAASFVMRYVPVPVAYGIVARLTPLYLLVLGRGYFERAARNMRQVLGPHASANEARELTRRAFANYARYMVDLVRLPRLSRAQILDGVRIEGWEHIEAGFAHGKGVVFATGHIGNWDLAGAVFAATGRPVSALVETLKPKRWNERVQRTRIAAGIKAIPIESGVRDMLSTLRKGEALAVLVDRPLANEGVPVTFFGRTTHVPGGAALLALRTGSPVVPIALVRDPAGPGYLAHIGAPILGDSDAQTVMQRIMNWLEGIISQYPDQWFMFRQMWPGTEQSRPVLAPRLSSFDY